MTSMFTVKDGGKFLIIRHSTKCCIFSLLVNTLDGDALYSRSNSIDLDMVKIKAKPLLYDHDSHSNSSCNEDDLEALALYSSARDIETH